MSVPLPSQRRLSRRTLLLQLLGVGAGLAIGRAQAGEEGAVAARSRPLFSPLQGPIPLPSDGLGVDRAGEALLFLAVQHPGEDSAIHQSGQEELQSSMLRDRDGNPFEQLRRVPLGSNWPGTSSCDVPLP